MSSLRRQLCVLGLAAILGAPPDKATAAVPVSFSRDILPILSDNCFACHGPDEGSRKSRLRLDTHEGALGKGRSGEVAVVPGDSAASEVIRRITSQNEDEVMPPPKSNRKLTAQQIDLLQRWVDEGAPWGRHWAYEIPQRPPVPKTQRSKLKAQNPIDHFILARLEKEGLTLSPEARKETLIRRVTLDLTGLPPTLEEIDAFLADLSPNAYEKVVDRLLASPRFGERLAWDWLDVARYADSNGFQGDPERTMWPWRDWVVRAFNENMPYDQFTIWQLAGDLLPPDPISQTPDPILATGFNRNHMHNGEGGRIPEETRVENVFDRVETTATVWLGLTMTCARCHDHKYDPFTLGDYFALYDIFNQTSEDGRAGGGARSGQIPPVLDLSTPAEEERLKKATQRFTAAVKEVEAFELKKFPRAEGKPLSESAASELPGNLPATLAKLPPNRRGVDALLEAIGYFETDGNDPEYVKVLKKLLAAVRERDAAQNNITRVMIMDQLEKPRDTFILVRGAYDKPTTNQVFGALPASLAGSARVPRADFGVPPKSSFLPAGAATAGPGVTPEPAGATPALPGHATRLDLARWLVSPDNPLTARVTVNRYWQMLFGTGLVKTAEDFGVQGEKPSHPELLDWLAVEFMAPSAGVEPSKRSSVEARTDAAASTLQPFNASRPRAWDLKALIRLMVTSATYRQSSAVKSLKSSSVEAGKTARTANRFNDSTIQPVNLHELDPENRLLARGPRYRMPSWMLRDVALAAGGLLTDTLGGPSVKPYQPEGVWEEATFGKKTYVQDHGEALYRRSLYVFWRRIVGPTMFFDSAARQVCEVKQKRTNTPLHALATLNDITYVEAARALAQRVMLAAPDANARLDQLYRLVLARKPTAAERQILLARLDILRQQFAADPGAAQRLLTVGESSRNEQLLPAEHAAWAGLCSLVLNLDEAISKE